MWQIVNTDYEIYVLLDTDIIETANGHFVLAAKSVIMEIDTCGHTVWSIQNDNYVLRSIAETSEGNYTIAGSLIVNNYDHSYIACISGNDQTTLWTNTEILYPSEVTDLIIDENDNLNICGYAPHNINKSQGFFAVTTAD